MIIISQRQYFITLNIVYKFLLFITIKCSLFSPSEVKRRFKQQNIQNYEKTIPTFNLFLNTNIVPMIHINAVFFISFVHNYDIEVHLSLKKYKFEFQAKQLVDLTNVNNFRAFQFDERLKGQNSILTVVTF